MTTLDEHVELYAPMSQESGDGHATYVSGNYALALYDPIDATPSSLTDNYLTISRNVKQTLRKLGKALGRKPTITIQLPRDPSITPDGRVRISVRSRGRW